MHGVAYGRSGPGGRPCKPMFSHREGLVEKTWSHVQKMPTRLEVVGGVHVYFLQPVGLLQ